MDSQRKNPLNITITGNETIGKTNNMYEEYVINMNDIIRNKN